MQLSKQIIGCALTAPNTSGRGFLDKIYENALAHKLHKAGLALMQQQGIAIIYDNIIVGKYFVDLLVDDAILTEMKTTGG